MLCLGAQINDLPVGRSVDETLRLVKAFQVRLPATDAPYSNRGAGWAGH
jgi:hypothetical protein